MSQSCVDFFALSLAPHLHLRHFTATSGFPKELHEVLKAEAEARGMCIATYIAAVLGTLQSIGALSPSTRSVNITNNRSEASNL